MPSKEDYQAWWERVWGERHQLLTTVFGETSPPGMVVSFSWDDFNLMIPGACAMEFPPSGAGRPEWLTISHGLSQPLQPAKKSSSPGVSGYGYEFGFLTRSKESWCSGALYQLLTYLKESKKGIARGHRVPVFFSKSCESSYKSTLGIPGSTEATFGEMRALLFWPYMAYPSGFDTSTGYFSILVGTTITQAEWELAKASSSSHLLLLLFEARIGQISDLARRTLTNDEKWQKRWDEINKLSQDQADEMLLRVAGAKT
jgi:hypothetical protein